MSDFREEVVSLLVQHTRNVGNRIDAKALLDELVALHQKHSVPDEPTMEMSNMGLVADYDLAGRSDKVRINAIYRAMIAAAKGDSDGA